MTVDDDELRDPPRLSEDPSRDDALRAWLEGGEDVPPPLPVAVRRDVRARLLEQTRRSRSRWWTLGVVALAAIALVAWLARGRAPESQRPALPPIVSDGDDASAPIEASDAGPPEDAEPPEDAGPLPHRDAVPWLDVTGSGCGLDVRVSLTQLDADVVSVAIVLDEVAAPAPVQGLVGSDCEGTVVRELDAGLFREAARVPSSLALPFSLGAPELACDHTYTLTACLRDGLGRLSSVDEPYAQPVRTSDTEENRHLGRIETPSGPTSPADLEPGHVITGFTLQTTPPWSTPGGNWPLFVDEVVVRIEDAHPTTLTRVRLEDGRALRLDGETEVHTERGLVRADALARGMRVRSLARTSEPLAGLESALGTRWVEIAEVSSAPRDPDAWPALRAIDVSYPDTLFVDGVLVSDGHPSRHTGPLAAAAPAPHELVRALPEPSWDCSLASELVVDVLPADVRSVAIVYAPHRGRAGQRRRLECTSASVGLELPRALLDVVPETDGARVLALQVPGWDAANEDWHPEAADGRRPTRASVRCSSAYDVMACVRGADGALSAMEGAEGRWSLTGPACFARGTAISTARGEISIESLRPGDRVTSRDPRDGEVREVRVRALIPRGVRPLRVIALSSGRALAVTDEHPLLDARTHGFREAASFVVGDHLLDVDGREVEVRATSRRGSAPVYDLSVDGPHTFFAEGVLAHNY